MNLRILYFLIFPLFVSCATSQKLAANLQAPKDSIVIRERVKYDTLKIPDYVVAYIDTTQCPPGLIKDSLVIKLDTIPVPGGIVVLPSKVRDTTIYVPDLSNERILGLQIDSLSNVIANLTSPGTGKSIQFWATTLGSLGTLLFGIILWFRNKKK